MTICDVCTPWVARTAETLRSRLRTVRRYPGTEFNKCPKCRDTEWATTSAFICTRERRQEKWWKVWNKKTPGDMPGV